MTDTASCDVLVVGGGPAGTTIATFLQRLGHRCLLLERSTFPRYHIGESLVPHTWGTLGRLGLLDALRASSFPVKRSVRFVGSSGHEAAPFYFSETIDGEAASTWQVERGEFDELCVQNARASGVEVLMDTRVLEVLFDGDGACGVRAVTAGGPARDIAARVVVDASGGATILGRQLGLRESVEGLEKAALWSYYRGGQRGAGRDAGETTIIRLEGGAWCWHIPLPEDIASVGIVGPPDRILTADGVATETFEQEVALCGPLARRLRDAERVEPVRGIGRLAYKNRHMTGHGWLMVGDAAMFLDPIYSSGILLALTSAEMASESVHEALVAGDLSAPRLGSYLPRLLGGVDVIHRLIGAFYDPGFRIRDFVERFPEHRSSLIDCLVGDVSDRDMSAFVDALATCRSAGA
jgi:flavin-dependent dehydrogenase